MTRSWSMAGILACCVLLSSVPVLAQGADYDKQVREARAALDAGRVAEAFDKAVAAARLDGNRFESYLVAALALYERGQHESAQDFAKIALGKAPQERRAAIEDLLRRLDPVSRQKSFDERIAAGNAAAQRNLAYLAGEEYEKAWRLFPERTDVALRAVQSYAAVEALSPALRLLRELALRAPSEKAQEIGEWLSKLEGLAHSSWQDLLSRAEAALESGDPDGALRLFAEAEELFPQRPEVFVRRAEIHAQRKDWEGAFTQIAAAVQRGHLERSWLLDRTKFRPLFEDDRYRGLIRGVLGPRGIELLDEVVQADRVAAEQRAREDAEFRRQREELAGMLESIRSSLQGELLEVKPGTFTMGSPPNEPNHDDDEIQHQVTLTRGFWMWKTELTQAQWTKVMGTTPWKGKNGVREGANYPAVYVSWNDAVEFCRRLTARERQAKRLPADWEYRLPTEAEWEYACRAGTTTAYSFGDAERWLGDYAWFAGNADSAGEKYAHEVGTKRANPWGFHDLHGNVWEWCLDTFGPYAGDVTDPLMEGGSRRVYRGGSWYDSAGYCRSANRYASTPDYADNGLGFRPVLARVP